MAPDAVSLYPGYFYFFIRIAVTPVQAGIQQHPIRHTRAGGNPGCAGDKVGFIPAVSSSGDVLGFSLALPDHLAFLWCCLALFQYFSCLLLFFPRDFAHRMTIQVVAQPAST